MIQIKHRTTGEVLFKGEYDDIAECVEAAVKSNIHLDYADLHNADLSNVILSGAELSHADLSGTNLRHTILSYSSLDNTNLQDADLYCTDLRGTGLSGVALKGACLASCTGNRSEIRSLSIIEDYPVAYTAEILQIGCEGYPFNEWWAFDDKRILKMGGKNALKLWRKQKKVLRKIIKLNPATKGEN